MLHTCIIFHSCCVAFCDDVTTTTISLGLGYYRRARMLHEGAKAVVERHNGQLPSDLETLLKLPGESAK